MVSYFSTESGSLFERAFGRENEIFSNHNQNECAVPEVVIFEPSSFEDMPATINALRKQQLVILNLAKMDFDEAQRAIDFLSGGTCMFNGSLEEIDSKVFIFAPQSTEILPKDNIHTARLQEENQREYVFQVDSNVNQLVSSFHGKVS